MALSPVGLAPAPYALQSPRPDLMQAAGSYKLAVQAPEAMEAPVLTAAEEVARHTELVEKFEAAEDASRDNREKAERDVDYYDGKQWLAEEIETLRKRNQPAITKNRIRRKIRFLMGLEQSQRTHPRASPRTPTHDQDAHAATAALRYVTDKNRYDQARSKIYKDLGIAGWGGTETTVEQEPDKQNPRIVIRRCQWDRMFWDPYSQEEDFSDATYLGLVLWMDRKEAVRRYGEGAGKVFDETVQAAQVGGTYDDRPKETTWVAMGKRQRVRVVQMYHRDDAGEWEFAEFTKGGQLQRGPSPWMDEHGKSEHPYEWASANVDRDNNRYGEVRDMIDAQDSVNKRESKFLHQVSVRQTYGTESALHDMGAADLRKELAKPDGHIRLGEQAEWGKNVGIIPTSDMAAGQFQLLQEAKAEMDLMGPNSAMIGKGPEDQSGRAILAQQQGGSVEMNPLKDALRDMDHRTYRKVWRRIRQFWTAEEWVPITDDPRNIKWVGLNTPAVDPNTGQPQIDPQTGQPAMQNSVAQLDVDIEIDDAPNMGSMQNEEFQALTQLAGTGLPGITPRMIIKASSLQTKGEILDEMDAAEKAAAEQGPPPDPEQAKAAAQMQMEQAKMQGQFQLEQAKMQSQLQMKQAELAANLEAEERRQQAELAFMQNKAAVELQIMRDKAQLDAMIKMSQPAPQAPAARQ